MRALVVLLMLACCAAAPVRADEPEDEEFPESEVIRGKRTSKESCEQTRDAVWVEHRLGSECIRFFPSKNLVGAKRAAFFFHGDVLDGRFILPGAYKDNRASVLRANVNGLARINRMPYVFVGRPGVYGSSGQHTDRRRLKEYLSLNAAVDAIKARYGLEEVLLGGQSGGAASVAALLTLGRDDVVCAAASSGPYDALARATDIYRAAGQSLRGCDVTGHCDVYNTTDHVAGVAKSAKRRIFIIGDPQDSNTAFKYQVAFADKLKAAGHEVTLVPAQARGPQRHGLAHMANRVMGWCNAGFDNERIVELVSRDTPALDAPASAPR